MINLDLLYDIPAVKVDKSKPYYNPDANIIYFRPIIPFRVGYYLEANQVDKNGNKQRYIIVSVNKIHEQCRPCRYDNYGRIKIRPYAFRLYLQDVYEHESNIRYSIDDINDEYVAIRLDD